MCMGTKRVSHPSEEVKQREATMAKEIEEGRSISYNPTKKARQRLYIEKKAEEGDFLAKQQVAEAKKEDKATTTNY